MQCRSFLHPGNKSQRLTSQEVNLTKLEKKETYFAAYRFKILKLLLVINLCQSLTICLITYGPLKRDMHIVLMNTDDTLAHAPSKKWPNNLTEK